MQMGEPHMSDPAQTLEHERRILPGNHVNLSPQAVQVGLPTDAHAASPSLRIIRDQGQITGIEVTCTCGCKMNIRCNYEA